MENGGDRPWLKKGLIGFGGAAVLGVCITLFVQSGRPSPSAFDQAVVGLKNVPFNPKATHADGYWVGDVSELYRMGLISREVAEADIAPLSPLVERPQPIGGYLVVAMETCFIPRGTEGVEEFVVLKGRKRSKDAFAFCVFP